MTAFRHTHDGGYSAACAACRLEGAGLVAAPVDVAFVNLARAKFRCFIWSAGQARALEMAADSGLSLREVVSAVHEARAEVGGRK